VHSIAHVRHMQDRYGHMLLWPRNARAGRARLFGRASIRWGASAPLKLVMGMARAALRAGARLR
jgi:hypothetical protein